jgi:hypothetical protein
MSANSIPFVPEKIRIKRGVVIGALLISALAAFEIFNYSTTDFALTDLLGELRFWGVRWATILALAFCGIDFAGVARLFAPDEAPGEDREVWYLFGAWLLAATMNALLTWWGVSIAILNHQSLGNAVVARETLLKVVPVFVAVLVWLLRILIIGLFSAAGERYFGGDQLQFQFAGGSSRKNSGASRRNSRAPAPSRAGVSAVSPAPKPTSRKSGGRSGSRKSSRPEPTYEPLVVSGSDRLQ